MTDGAQLDTTMPPAAAKHAPPARRFAGGNYVAQLLDQERARGAPWDVWLRPGANHAADRRELGHVIGDVGDTSSSGARLHHRGRQRRERRYAIATVILMLIVRIVDNQTRLDGDAPLHIGASPSS